MLASRDRGGFARRGKGGGRRHRVDVALAALEAWEGAGEGDLKAIRRPGRARMLRNLTILLAQIVGCQVSVSATVAVHPPDLPCIATDPLALLHEHDLGAVRGPVRRIVECVELVSSQNHFILAVRVHREDLPGGGGLLGACGSRSGSRSSGASGSRSGSLPH